MQVNDSFEKTLMLWKIENRRRRGQQEDEMGGWHCQLNGHELGELQELVMDSEALRASVHGVAVLDTAEQLSWTEQKFRWYVIFVF